MINKNRYLTNHWKEKLLYHHKLRIQIQHIELFIKAANVVEPSERKFVKDKIITPKYRSTPTCDTQKFQLRKQANAKQQKSKPTNSKVIEDAEGAIT